MPKLADHTRASRRQVLIEAGWKCLARLGGHDLRVEDICHEAAMSKGAFYGYFPHKQAFLLALLEDEEAGVEGLMLDLELASSNAGERLRGFAGAMLRRAQEPGRVQLVADIWSGAQTDPGMHQLLVAVTAKRRERLRRWVERGSAEGELIPAPANALASLLLAFGDGLAIHARLDPEAFRWDNVGRAMDLLLSALQPA
ncbi:MAG TPA: TetR/AcrR family transcriptional regulator [Candidatus Nanopelagicaceae bacterium]|nr:TetR/AcrR family transcriptional regulator [Candidatus Nanopelagicaceae bacterium]